MFLVRRGFDPDTVRTDAREAGRLRRDRRGCRDGARLGPGSNETEDDMVTSDAETPDEYVAALPEDRREAVSAVRDVDQRAICRRASWRACSTG